MILQRAVVTMAMNFEEAILKSYSRLRNTPYSARFGPIDRGYPKTYELMKL